MLVSLKWKKPGLREASPIYSPAPLPVHCRKMLIKQRNSFNTFQVVKYAKALVGRVNGIFFQTKAHKHRVQPQFLLKEGNNRNTAALPR